MKSYLYLLIFFIPYFSLFSNSIDDIVGTSRIYTIKKGQTLIDISRKYNLAFPEVMLSNPDIKDPWVLKEGKIIKLPSRHILPSGKREGIIINKGDLRAYFFKNENVYTFPIGIGRANWDTPIGYAKVTGKRKNPYWTVPKSILEEEPDWPNVVKPGPDNPLGTRAIYFSMPGYLLHGTNKPWGVGMRVSHGCIRFFPEGIEKLYDMINEGDKVKIVDQKVKAGWQGGVLYLEVHTMHTYGLEEDEEIKPNIRLLPEAAKIIQSVAGIYIAKINWKKVTEIVRLANGMPEAVLTIYNN